MAESGDLAAAVAQLRERVARLEAELAAREVRLEPLLEEKEALLQEMERLAAQRQAGAVPPDLYESSVRALVERLALLDEEVSLAARAQLPGRVDAVEGDLSLLARGLADIERGFRGLKEDLERVAGTGPLEGLRRAVDALTGEVRENVRRLLAVDARTIEQLKEVQGLLRGGRMDALETEMGRIRDLYREFVSEDRIAQFTRQVREVFDKEELEPLRRSVDRVEVALERQSEEVRTGVERLREDARVRFEALRGEVEALRQEALRVQREQVALLQARVEDLARGFAEQTREIPALREQVGSFQRRIEGLSGDLKTLSDRVRYRPVGELERERVRLEGQLDLLRGAAEKGAISREQFEVQAAPLKSSLAEIRERLFSQRRMDALARFVAAQRKESKRILDELQKVPGPEQIRGLLEKMRSSMAGRELEELRGEMQAIRAALRNRIEELPLALEAHLREVPERQARALVTEMRREAERLAASLGERLRREMEARLPPEVERHGARSRDALLEEMRRLSAETGKALREVSEEVSRLRLTVESVSEHGPALRRDLERVQERMDSLARRVERPGLESLLALKEEALRRIERLQADGARGLLPPNRFEAEMKRAVAEAADIDSRIEEALRMERVLARLQEHGQRVEAMARSVEEMKGTLAAGVAREGEREKTLLERVRQMLREEETVLLATAETRLRSLQADIARQREAAAAAEARMGKVEEALSRASETDVLRAESEERLQRALALLAEQQEALRDALAASDLRRSKAESAAESRLRALEEGQRRLDDSRAEVERLQRLVLAGQGGPRKRGLADLEAERNRLIEFIQGLSPGGEGASPPRGVASRDSPPTGPPPSPPPRKREN
ncbi:MAG: hypothetical protein QXO51_00410 [Halobacteria archaeon]